MPICAVTIEFMVILFWMTRPMRLTSSPVLGPPTTSPPRTTPDSLATISFTNCRWPPGMELGCLSTPLKLPTTISNPSFFAMFSVSPAAPKPTSPMHVEKIPMVPPMVFTEESLYRFIPAILASAQAVEASITVLGLRVRKSRFSAQSPTANTSGSSVLIYSSTRMNPSSLVLIPASSAREVLGR